VKRWRRERGIATTNPNKPCPHYSLQQHMPCVRVKQKAAPRIPAHTPPNTHPSEPSSLASLSRPTTPQTVTAALPNSPWFPNTSYEHTPNAAAGCTGVHRKRRLPWHRTHSKNTKK
jgi:hypothetical protein